jgi:hypothetical protein
MQDRTYTFTSPAGAFGGMATVTNLSAFKGV